MNLNLLVTVDVDNDGTTIGASRDLLRWDGIAQVEALHRLFAEMHLPATWFLRADNQLADVYGSPAYLFDAHAVLWQKLRLAGDEIAWHPHLYHREPNAGKFAPDYDPQRCTDKLRATYAELRASGWECASVRIGEAFHSNEMMAALDEFGLMVDSTAIPGRVRSDAERRMDWGPTPNEPYHPSARDYRVPGADALGILEFPMTTVFIQAPYDSEPRRRYANLAYHAPLFTAAVERYLQERRAAEIEVSYLTLILHPDEVVARPEAHPLCAYSLAAVRSNLDFLLELAARLQMTVRPLTATSAGAAFELHSL